MKKTFLLIALFFIAISSSFAYQQTITAPSNGVPYATMVVNVNSYCNFVNFRGSWWSIGQDAGGQAQAYGESGANSGTLIGEHSLWQGSSYSFVRFNQSWGTIRVYLSAFNSSGQATIEWN